MIFKKLSVFLIAPLILFLLLTDMQSEFIAVNIYSVCDFKSMSLHVDNFWKKDRLIHYDKMNILFQWVFKF